MEIRTENEMLVDRIRDIIRKEVRAFKEEEENEQEEPTSETKTEKNKEETAEIIYEETTQNPKATNRTGLPDSALETFE